jgi:hypothetical protein
VPAHQVQFANIAALKKRYRIGFSVELLFRFAPASSRAFAGAPLLGSWFRFFDAFFVGVYTFPVFRLPHAAACRHYALGMPTTLVLKKRSKN